MRTITRGRKCCKPGDILINHHCVFLFLGKNFTGKVRSEMFTRLIDYFNGENVGKVKLDMTVPVMTFVFKRFNVTVMLFFIPLKHQASPPKPMNPEVSIPNVGKTCAYVK